MRQLTMGDAQSIIRFESTSIEQFSGRKYIGLETYKKGGEPKLTPVQSLKHEGLVYVRTDPRSWKVRRIARNPHVRIVPTDGSGKPNGKWVEGDARMLEGEERVRMLDLLEKEYRKEYGAIRYSVVSFMGRLAGRQMTAVIAIKLEPAQATATS